MIHRRYLRRDNDLTHVSTLYYGRVSLSYCYPSPHGLRISTFGDTERPCCDTPIGTSILLLPLSLESSIDLALYAPLALGLFLGRYSSWAATLLGSRVR